MIKFLRFGVICCLLVAVLLVGIAAALAYQTSNFRQSAATAHGTVVQVVEQVSHNDEGTSVVYVPRVQFRTPGGQDIDFTSSTGSNPPAYHQGDAVEVLYNPASPSDASINSFWQLWLAPVICTGIGTVFFAFGLALTVLIAFLTRDRKPTAPYAMSARA